MQKVAWPTTIVAVENVIPAVRALAFRARPVTIPGRAIGRTSDRENASRPKNENRWIANAAREPSTTAARLENRATWTDRPIASRTDGFSHADPNHCVLNSRIGYTWIRWALKAYRAMTAIGR